MEEGSERERERGAREGATQHSDENIAHIAPLLHHRVFISGLSLITLIPPPSRSVFQHCSIGACACEQRECRRTPRLRPAPHRHATGHSSVSTLQYNHNMSRSFSPDIWGRSTGLDHRSIGTARFSFVDDITRWAWMSKSSAESQSRGGSVRDVRMASSNNTSPEGGTPPHQNRIRQVSVCVCGMNEAFRFLVFCVFVCVCGRVWHPCFAVLWSMMRRMRRCPGYRIFLKHR